MNRWLAVAALCLLAPAATVQAATIDDLAWLTGCWAANGREPGSIELWMPAAGGAMLGMNRVISGGRMTGFEYMRIVEVDDESLVLTASPSGQASTDFRLLSIGEFEVSFENPDHDFPQRIIYRRVDENRLLGRIEGDAGDGNVVAIDFPMTRTTC